ncbi:hypothetical protein H4R19_002723, partial [Coemansia spiralis]
MEDTRDTPSPQPQAGDNDARPQSPEAAQPVAEAAPAAEQQPTQEQAPEASEAPDAAAAGDGAQRAEGSVAPLGQPGRVDMTDALTKARAIAAKFGTMQNPLRSAPAPAAVGPVAGASEGSRGGDARPSERPSRRSASPSDDDGYERRHKRDRSRDGRDGRTMGRGDSRRRFDGHGDQGYQPPGQQPVLQFPVPTQLSGLIIGRSGANLRSIEQRHGVRIQFDPSADRRNPERQISIEGPVPAAEAARQDIMDFVDRHHAERQGPPPSQGYGASGASSASGPSGASGAVTLMVPSSKVGLIIGRGGETIKDIQYATGAGVQVQPDNGAPERQIQLLGAPDQVEAARARIMDIVVGDSRPMRDSGPSYGGGFQQQQPQMGYPQQARSPGYPAPQDGRPQGGMPQGGMHHLEEMQIPMEAVGIIIGRGGETIKFLQQSTGTRIQVLQGSEHTGQFRPVTIAGDYAACMRTRQMIEEKIDGMQERHGGGYGGDRRGPAEYGSGPTGDRYAQPMRDGMYGQMQQQQPYQRRDQGGRFPDQ